MESKGDWQKKFIKPLLSNRKPGHGDKTHATHIVKLFEKSAMPV